MLSNNRLYGFSAIILMLLCIGFFYLSCKVRIEEQELVISDELLKLESEYSEMLEPIQSIKESDPEMYWFIVSWLKTNYGTPIWKDYGSEDWVEQAKQKGIDCSGFARVMQEEIFRKKIRGSSQGILDTYCERVSKKNIQKGDLLFFKAPFSKTYRIVHVGVYLQDNYFVHATSTRSASEGLGLNIESMQVDRWKDELVAVGRVENKYRLE